MRSIESVRKRTWFVVGSFLTLMILILAACGTNTGGSGTGSTGSSPSTTPTATAPTSASAYGCPGPIMANSPAPANVVLKQSDSNATVTAHVGDVVEIDLAFGQSWSGPNASQGALQLQTPTGYALTASKVCVWRFTAHSTGTTLLSFTGKAICKKGQVCPLYILRVSYTVVVK